MLLSLLKQCLDSSKSVEVIQFKSLSNKLSIDLHLSSYSEARVIFIDPGYFIHSDGIYDQTINKVISLTEHFDTEINNSLSGYDTIREMADAAWAESMECGSLLDPDGSGIPKEQKINILQAYVNNYASVQSLDKEYQVDCVYIIQPDLKDEELKEWFRLLIAATKHLKSNVEELYDEGKLLFTE